MNLDHAIVFARDRRESAAFLAELLGLPAPHQVGPFLAVDVSEDFTLDYVDHAAEFPAQHYAFLVSEAEFDEIFGRIRAWGVAFWADPHAERPGEFNTNDGGRGLYFLDPAGHGMEILTRRYGSGG